MQRRGRITVLYILIRKFLDGKEEGQKVKGTGKVVPVLN
jgi:hypothetical protein